MNYVRIDYDNIINGPGVRAVLWVRGCYHRCPECHNPETWDHGGGNFFSHIEIDEIKQYLKKNYVNGITISGGDPLSSFNRGQTLFLIKELKEEFPSKSVWIYTGYTWEELMDELSDVQKEQLFMADVLIDGRYKKELNVKDQYRGSSNQRLIDISKTLDRGYICLWESYYGGQ